uniref:Uncharacterized protein n=1 Tax=virus sp. ct5rm7 TaxID=2827298 RepID=A0A8S5RGK7_9VIRU|nr:MAG TPA: hypothetical protein [virus sp. ct5rm7]
MSGNCRALFLREIVRSRKISENVANIKSQTDKKINVCTK